MFSIRKKKKRERKEKGGGGERGMEGNRMNRAMYMCANVMYVGIHTDI